MVESLSYIYGYLQYKQKYILLKIDEIFLKNTLVIEDLLV